MLQECLDLFIMPFMLPFLIMTEFIQPRRKKFKAGEVLYRYIKGVFMETMYIKSKMKILILVITRK